MADWLSVHLIDWHPPPTPPAILFVDKQQKKKNSGENENVLSQERRADESTKMNLNITHLETLLRIKIDFRFKV